MNARKDRARRRALLSMACLGAIFLSIVAVQARAAPPDLPTVQKLEHEIKLPAGSYPLNGYDRYYYMGRVSGRRVIVGLYLATRIADEEESFGRGDHDVSKPFPLREGRLHLLAKESMAPASIADGGCEEISVFWDVATAKVAGVYCNGLA